MNVRVYHGTALATYGFGQGHPFGSDRLEAFWREAVKQGLDQRVTHGEPVTCTPEDLALFHTAAYIQRVRALPGVKAWIDGALAEHDFLDFEEPYRISR